MNILNIICPHAFGVRQNKVKESKTSRGVQKTYRLVKPDPTRQVGLVFKAW